MVYKLGLFLCVLALMSAGTSQIVAYVSKIRVSPPRPANRPMEGGTSGGGKDKCGGNYMNLTAGKHGVITSPGYPNFYASGLECEWVVEGEPGSSVYATLFDIRTQNAVFSEISDSLYLSLNGNWSDSQRLSGDLNPVTPLLLISDGNRLLLRFKSSSFSTGNRGFRLAYYITSTGKPAITEIGHDTYTVISCTYVPVDHPMVFPGSGQSLRETSRVNPNPFLVGIVLDERQFCSGTLVSDRHVITSAHCTKGAKRIDLVFGTSDLLVEDKGVQKRTVNSSSVIEHPHFDTFTGGNDISVIKLSEPIQFNDLVLPAALPTWAYIGTTLSGLNADITGWGDTKNGKVYSKASSKSVRVHSNAACRAYNRESTGNSMCTQDNSTSTCQTDSGSPIVTRGNICGGQTNQGGQGNQNVVASKPSRPHKPNRPHFLSSGTSAPQMASLLLGVVSHGSCEKGFSATRITAYMDFLSQTIGPLE